MTNNEGALCWLARQRLLCKLILAVAVLLFLRIFLKQLMEFALTTLSGSEFHSAGFPNVTDLSLSIAVLDGEGTINNVRLLDMHDNVSVPKLSTTGGLILYKKPSFLCSLLTF